jgi:hypothetical protein
MGVRKARRYTFYRNDTRGALWSYFAFTREREETDESCSELGMRKRCDLFCRWVVSLIIALGWMDGLGILAGNGE